MCGRFRLESSRNDSSGGFKGNPPGNAKRTSSRSLTPEGLSPRPRHSLGRLTAKVASTVRMPLVSSSSAGPTARTSG